jgi:cytosine deaminase
VIALRQKHQWEKEAWIDHASRHRGSAGRGGILIGAVIAHQDRIIGRGRIGGCNWAASFCMARWMRLKTRVGSLRTSIVNARSKPRYHRARCRAGAILLCGIPRIVMGENRTFIGDEDLLRGA